MSIIAEERNHKERRKGKEGSIQHGGALFIAPIDIRSGKTKSNKMMEK